MKDIIVVGGGGHAKVVISIIKKNMYRIIGYTDIKNNGSLLGVSHLGNDEIVSEYPSSTLLALGIGQLKDSIFRKKVVSFFATKGFQFETITSPYTIINEEVCIGQGTVIMDGVVINSETSIGKFCIINTRSSIDHDCSIGDFTHIAPGATICGGVKIGDDSMVGSGVTIIQNLKIGRNTIIGAGSVVTKDIPDNVIAYGNPCKIVRENSQ